MGHDVRDIPPAPRAVRWCAVLECRLPLAGAGFLLGIYGGLVALMLFWAHQGKPRDDAQLTAACERVSAQVIRIRPCAKTVNDQPMSWFDYEFVTPPGMRVVGHCIGFEGQFALHSNATVEYLLDRPEVNRLQGTRLSLLGDFVTPVLALAVLPGATLLAWWWLSVLRLRRCMRTGDVAAAEILGVQRIAYVCPVMLRVRFRFRDHHAVWHSTQHWVRARSAAGVRLTSSPAATRLAVVHLRGAPQDCRLTSPADFVQPPNVQPTSAAAPKA